MYCQTNSFVHLCESEISYQKEQYITNPDLLLWLYSINRRDALGKPCDCVSELFDGGYPMVEDVLPGPPKTNRASSQ